MTTLAAPSHQTNGRTQRPRAITIAIMAMGGEGGGVLADWIVDVAEHAGYYAQTTSVPGVAQRTGATIYYLEIFPEAAVAQAGRPPVLALMPVPGEVDVVIASELMEAGRAVQRGLVTPERTTLIASTHRVYSMTEKTAMADGRVDSGALIDAGAAAAKRFVQGDFAAIAEETRSVISAALFGALAATGVLPFSREQCEDAIRRGGVGVASSLTAFGAGFAEASTAAARPAVTAPRRRSRLPSHLSGRDSTRWPRGCSEHVPAARPRHPVRRHHTPCRLSRRPVCHAIPRPARSDPRGRRAPEWRIHPAARNRTSPRALDGLRGRNSRRGPEDSAEPIRARGARISSQARPTGAHQ